MTAAEHVVTLLGLRGSATFGNVEDAGDIIVAVQALKDGGHAITCDETFDHEKRFVDIRVCHYLTCVACKHLRHAQTAAAK